MQVSNVRMSTDSRVELWKFAGAIGCEPQAAGPSRGQGAQLGDALMRGDGCAEVERERNDNNSSGQELFENDCAVGEPSPMQEPPSAKHCGNRGPCLHAVKRETQC